MWKWLQTGLVYQKASLSVSACPLCEHREAWLLSQRDGKSGQTLNTVLCQSCGLARVDPLPDTQALSRYYRHDYRRDYKKTYQPRPKHIWRAQRLAQERANFLASFLKDKPNQHQLGILDIGSGGGEFIAHMAAQGHKAVGIEPNQGYAAFARERYGLTVHIGTLAEAMARQGEGQVDVSADSKRFDVVTSFHVFEHVVHPLEWLRLAKQCLSPDGYLLLEVPNILNDRAAPGNVYFMAHLFHYSPQTLMVMAKKAGLICVATDQAATLGVVRMVFQHAEHAGLGASELTQPVVAQDQSHAEQVWQAHCRRTWINYLCSAHALKRAGQRIRQYAREWTLVTNPLSVAVQKWLSISCAMFFV